ncbi:MAG TPA: LysE family transporter [Solirubrobacteraceae bacterium]|nr:LysE family transporter [Solirubrobacteraceae bacterium]
MLHALVTFLPVAAMLAISPGPATALVVHSAARGGRQPAVLATAGDAVGLALWAVASMFGVSALVAASATAFTVLKIVGAVVLVWFGIQALRRARSPQAAGRVGTGGRPFSRGVATALANPKVGVFYVALLPQFVPEGSPLLPTTLLLAASQITLSVIWYLLLVTLVSRARAAFVRGARRLEAISGAALIGFGIKLASDARR